MIPIPVWAVLAGIVVVFIGIGKWLFFRALFRAKVLQWAHHEKRAVKNEAKWVWVIAFVLTLAVGVGEYVKQNNPVLSTQYSLWMIFGFVLTALGLWVAVGALDARKQYFWILQVLGPKETLPPYSTNGVYATVRHPRELSILLLISGLALVFGLKYTLVLALVFLLPAAMLLVNAKDRNLIDKYGKPYIEHTTRSRKLIPYVW